MKANISSKLQSVDNELLKAEFGISSQKLKNENDNLILIKQTLHEPVVLPRLQFDQYDIHKD